MQTVKGALAVWTPPSAPAYEHYKYPARYAWAFLADSGGRIIPEEIQERVTREVMSKTNAQGEPRKKRYDHVVMVNLMLQAWVKETGEDEWGTMVMLAEAFLSQRGIDAPPERHEKR